MGDHELEAVREQLKQSDEWQCIVQKLNEEVKQTATRTGHKDLPDFSGEDKIFLTKKAARAVQKTDRYAALQRKSFSIVEQNFPRASHGITNNSASGDQQENLVRVCSTLLKRRPDLRQHLRRSINLPLPCRLRCAAWSAFLHDPLIREDVHLGLQELGKRQASLVQQCDAVLQSRPLLAQLSSIPLFTQSMAMLLKLWQRRTHSSVPDSITTNTVLLTVPFLYINKDSLTSSGTSSPATASRDGKELNLNVLSSIAEMFIYFMEMLPLTMRSNSSNEVAV